MSKLARGFTLVELIVVISVIGILSTIGVVSYIKVQANSRDSQRSSKISAIAEALEKYYDQNGEYPGCQAMTQDTATVSSSTLINIDQTALLAPEAPDDADTSVQCQALSSSDTSSCEAYADDASGSDDCFAYVGDGSSGCATGADCLQYTLEYREESTGNIISLTSRHQVSLATSSTPSLSGSATYTSVTLNWTTVNNAANYELQMATNSSFTGNTDYTIATTPTSKIISSLTSNTTYYFRIRALGQGSNVGNWSSTLTLSTPAVGAATMTATANSSTQITAAWTAVTNATSYTLQQSTTSDFSSGVTTYSGLSSSTLSKVQTGLGTGVAYYYRVDATVAGVVGPWSNIDTATTFVPAPASISCTDDSATQITCTWATVSVADSYALEYDVNSNFSTSSTNTGITATSGAATGLLQGRIYYFRVYAYVGTVPSVPSSSTNATTIVNKPSTPSVTASIPGAVRAYSAGAWVGWPSNDAKSGNWYYADTKVATTCPSGTTDHYHVTAKYSSSSTTYTVSDTTTQTLYMIQPTSGYSITFSAYAWCKGTSATSGNTSTKSASASN